MSILQGRHGGAEIVESVTTAPEPLLWSSRRIALEALKSFLATAFVFFFTIYFLAQGYLVYGSCMDPNLCTGERLLGSKLAYRLHTPDRGDIVIFKLPTDPSKIYIKRVIGLPGEVVEIRNGAVYIDGDRLNESYVTFPPHGNYPARIVEPGRLFVMGDNRDLSNDSRYWGQLPIKDVQAKAWVRYWPFSRASGLQ